MLIGILHSNFAPGFYKQMIKVDALAEQAAGFTYFFAFMGFAIAFAGFLTLYAASALQRQEPWARTVTLMAAWFVMLGGASAVLYAGFGNPLIYIMSLLAFINIVILTTIYRK